MLAIIPTEQTLLIQALAGASWPLKARPPATLTLMSIVTTAAET